MSTQFDSFDPGTQAGPVPSPCIDICQMNPATGLCVGCWRTIDEIVIWGSAPDATKRAIWQELRRRAEQAF
ncbi:MAG TPA: DUF1289 domain-containing protein [Burkholderiaceae bacterium]